MIDFGKINRGLIAKFSRRGLYYSMIQADDEAIVNVTINYIAAVVTLSYIIGDGYVKYDNNTIYTQDPINELYSHVRSQELKYTRL